MAKFLLTEQHVNRGFESNFLIGAFLEKMGHKVGFSLTGLNLKKNIIKFKPDVIYMPWVSKEIHDFIKTKNKDMIIINSFQEQLTIIDNFNDYFMNYIKLADYTFLWGQKFKTILEEKNIDSNYIITGAPRLDLYSNENLRKKIIPSKKEMAKKHDLSYEKEWILIIMDFPILFKYDDSTIKNLYEKKIVSKEYYESTKKGYDKLNLWLKRICNDKVIKDKELIIRPHPGSNLERIKADQKINSFDNVNYIYDGNINKWIINSDKYITRFSTSIIEAWVANKNNLLIMEDLLTKKYKNYIHIKNSKMIANDYYKFKQFIINYNKENPDINKSILKNIFYKLDGNSSYRTAVKLDQLPNKKDQKIKSSNFSIHDYIIIFKFIISNFINKYKLYKLPFLSKYYSGEYISQNNIDNNYNEIKNILMS